MKIISLLNHSASLLKIILSSYSAPDKVAASYLKSKKYLGSNDRKFISETVFSCLRNKTLLELISKPAGLNIFKEPEMLVASSIIGAFCNIIPGYHPLNIISKFENPEDEFEFLSQNLSVFLVANHSYNINIKSMILKHLSTTTEMFSANSTKDKVINEELLQFCCIPAWILDRWVEGITADNYMHALNIACSFREPAYLNVRVQSMRRDEALDYLQNKGVNCEPGIFSPFAIIIKDRINLLNLDIYKKGFLEVQDEGSQLISLALAPVEGSSILDACAGAGGKSLHLASITNDNVKLTASDISFSKLKELQKRARIGGFKSISAVHIKPGKSHDKLGGQLFDYVLVDAPCSGIGTARRSPMIKWRLDQKLLSKLQATQMQILQEYSAYVKPGGALVYSTCSLMPGENEHVVESFLQSDSSFSPERVSDALEQYGINIKSLYPYLTLNPYDHGTDGFFISRFKKNISTGIY